MYLIRREDQDHHDLIEAKADNDWRRSVFATDLHHGLERYKKLFPTEISAEEEFGGEIVEVVPENERELAKVKLDMARAGFKFAE